MYEVWKPTLTSQPSIPYPEYGDTFMPTEEDFGIPPQKPKENAEPEVPQAKGNSDSEESQNETRQGQKNPQKDKDAGRPKTETDGSDGNDGGKGKPPTASGSPEEPDEQEGEPSVGDRKAADLIAEFKQDIRGSKRGEDRREDEEFYRKEQRLRRNLSQRIREMERQQDELGDSPGAYTSDGKLTSDVAAKIDKINGDISQIHGYFGTQERGRRGDPEVNRVVEESNHFFNGLLGRGLNKDEINDLSEHTKLTVGERETRARLVHGVKEAIEKSGPIDSNDFNSDILFAVRHFKELREELISEILFKSFGDKGETNEYEITLYAASNLDTLLGFLSKDDSDRYKELFSLKTATRFFQSMNATVLKGTFDSFGHAAENINFQHFENMRDIGGSGLAMRLYEQAYKDALASDKRVMQDKIPGIKKFVETTFKEINEAGLIKSEYSQYRADSRMEDWEVQRALAAGRSFLNITLRAAESIATGRVPEDERRFASEPQEDMVRILNWNEWLLKKFSVGGDKTGRHGEDFLKMSTGRFQDFLRYKGAKLNLNKITEFGGVNVRTMEDGGQYRTSGIFSGWRLQNMAFDQIYLRDESGNMIKDETRVLKPEEDTVLTGEDGKAFMTVKGFRDQKEIKDQIKAIKDRIDKKQKAHPDESPGNWVTPEDQEAYKEIFMPVVNQLNFGLSMLLKNGDFGFQDNKLGYLLRTEIWKKIAKTNTPLMIDYLTGIKYEWDKLGGEDGIDEKLATLRANKNKSTEEKREEAQLQKERKELIEKKTAAEAKGSIAKSLEQLRSESGEVWKDEKKWQAFKDKVLIRFERTIREGMGEDPLAVDELSADEKKMEDAIKLEGEKLAPHLADIVFAYTPFMNDMPFEKFKYNIPGQTFYKRRTVSDLGGFNKGQQAYAKILDNPGGIPIKEAVEAMKEIVAGVAGPEGPRAGMEANMPTFSALLDVVMAEPGKRQAIIKMMLEATRKETSLAQKWSGIKAESIIESEAANVIDEATKQGILNPELARYLKKNKKLAISAIIWMLFRDVFITMVPVFVVGELIGTLKGK